LTIDLPKVKSCDDCPAASAWLNGKHAKYAQANEKLCFGYALFGAKAGKPIPCSMMEAKDCLRPNNFDEVMI
jgi:hypothetical protein